ncbi:MAG: hypothetical protein ACI9SP_000250 [Arenicella sp.]|jgi:hypothetical protein
MTELICAKTGAPITGNGDAYWDDGEWVSWDYIDSKLYTDNINKSWDDYYEIHPVENSSSGHETLRLSEMLGKLVEVARAYLASTGRHLPIYGEMGELYGEIKYGINRHKENTPGSDGRLDDDWVEIKTISPHKSNDVVQVKRAGNFNKLLIVKISDEFKFKAHMVDRKDLKKGDGKFAKASWPKGK